MLKLGILRDGDSPGLSGQDQCNRQGPYKKEAGGSETETGDVMTEAEVGLMTFEDGGEGAMSKNVQAASRSQKS